MTVRTIQSHKFGSAATAKAPKGKVTADEESATLVEANPGRVSLRVYNVGEKDVYLALGATAVAEEGIYLKAETGSEKIDDYSGIVTAIAVEEESLLTYSEV